MGKKMGCGSTKSALPDSVDRFRIINDTDLPSRIIDKVYARFTHLDKAKKGYLDQQDLLLLLGPNPLGQKLVDTILYPPLNLDENVEKQDHINFRNFCELISIFQPRLRRSADLRATAVYRLTFLFRLMKSADKSYLDAKAVQNILSITLGDHINNDEIRAIAEKAVFEVLKRFNKSVIDWQTFLQISNNLGIDKTFLNIL